MPNLKGVASLLLLTALSACATTGPAAPQKFGDTGFGPRPGGGGLSSITVTAPLTGDGSVGTPAGIRASTTTLSGSMSAAQASTLANLALVSPWAAARAAELIGYVPALTRCIYPGKMGWAVALGVGSANAAQVEGGGFSVGGGATNFISVGGITVVPKSGSLGLAWRGKYAVPVSGRTTTFGLSDVGESANHSEDIATKFTVDPTHFIMRIGAASAVFATLVSPTTLYNFTLYADGTNFKGRINDADVQTIAQSNVVADENQLLYNFASTTGDLTDVDVVLCLP